MNYPKMYRKLSYTSLLHHVFCTIRPNSWTSLFLKTIWHPYVLFCQRKKKKDNDRHTGRTKTKRALATNPRTLFHSINQSSKLQSGVRGGKLTLLVTTPSLTISVLCQRVVEGGDSSHTPKTFSSTFFFFSQRLFLKILSQQKIAKIYFLEGVVFFVFF